MTTAGLISLILTFGFSLAQLSLAGLTIWLATYPVRPVYRGFGYEAELLFLFIKKHILGFVISNPLTQAEFAKYDSGREIAKNVFFSVINVGPTIFIARLALNSFEQDPGLSTIDVLFATISAAFAIIQIRIYDSERRIFNGKVSTAQVSNVLARASTSAREQSEHASDPIEISASTKPIFERIDREAFAKSIKINGDIDRVIEDDKRRVEQELSNSKWSKMFELSGSRRRKASARPGKKREGRFSKTNV